MSVPRNIGRPLTVLVAAVVALVAPARPAAAHVEPTVTEAPAGSRAEIGFTVEHGCAGSPTVAVAMQVPGGVDDVEPAPLDGWVTSVEGDVVTWAGGPLPDGEAATFTLAMGLPVTPGETLLFPTVQTCEQGELAWISVEGGESEDDNPAPRILLTDLDPARTTTTTTTTSGPAPTPTTDAQAPAAAIDEDDGLGAWPWVLGGTAVVVAAGLAATAVARRRPA